MKKEKEDQASFWETPDNQTLIDAIVSWPENSIGYRQEKETVILLNTLCKKYGYGRIPQIASIIEEIWRDPNAATKYKKEMKKHRATMAKYRDTLKTEK